MRLSFFAPPPPLPHSITPPSTITTPAELHSLAVALSGLLRLRK